MSSLLASRTNVPQAFVSSYAPRLRNYANSLLTPVQPTNAVPPLRSTKRGTTAVNYSEEFEDEGVDDSDAPRRATGLRSRRVVEEQKEDKPVGKEQGKVLVEPIEVQAIWREWMGKPKRHMYVIRRRRVKSTLANHWAPTGRRSKSRYKRNYLSISYPSA